MLDINTANKQQLRAAMRAADLPYDGLNVEGMRAALHAAGDLGLDTGAAEAAPVVQEEVPAVVVPETDPETVEIEQLVAAGIAPEPLPIVAPTVPVPVSKPARREANGVKQPATGTICRQIWDYCDEVYNAGQMPAAKALRAWGAGKLDDTTMTIQFYRWRKFTGISGRQA